LGGNRKPDAAAEWLHAFEPLSRCRFHPYHTEPRSAVKNSIRTG
jgi:hypothetical protein